MRACFPARERAFECNARGLSIMYSATAIIMTKGTFSTKPRQDILLQEFSGLYTRIVCC